MNWSLCFVNCNGKCNCIRERNGLSGFRVWIKRIFSFFRHLVHLRFVSCRVAASFVLWFSCVSFRFVSTRRVSFPFVSPLRSSSPSLAFRFVPCRHVVEDKKETNQEKQQTNPNSYQPLAGPMNKTSQYCARLAVGVCWSWGFVNRNGKCNCIRERSGLSGSRVWINANFSFFLSFFFLLSSSSRRSSPLRFAAPLPLSCVF